MRILSGLIGLIVILAALAFTLSNRQSVVVSFWPFDAETPAVPLGPLVLGAFFLGLLVGAMIVWLNLLPHRFKARRLRKDLTRLQGKIEDMRQSVMPPGGQNSDRMLSGPQPTRPVWRKFR